MPSVAYNADYHGETTTESGMTMKIVLVANHTNAAATFTPSFKIEVWGKSTIAGDTVTDVWVNTNGYAGSTTYKRCITKSSYTFAKANTWYVVGSLTVTTSNATTYLISNMAVVNKTHSTQSLKLGYTKSASYDNCALQIIGGFTNYNSHNILINGDITITGIPAKTTYTVSYNANGGSGAPSSQTKWYGENLTLSSTTPTKTNYTFKRWNTDTSDSGTAYNASGTYSANSAATLYAIWNPVISYNANGGSGAPSSQTKTFGTDLTLSATKPTKTGYVFSSWNTASDGSGTSYQPSGTFTSNTATTLYAQWETALGITSATVTRCDSNGNEDVMGGYVKSSVTWFTRGSGSGSTVALVCSNPNASATKSVSGSSATTTVGPMTPSNGSFRADTSYTFTATLTDSLGNTTTKSVTSSASSTGYYSPTLSSLSVIRCSSNGTPADEGTYGKLTFEWGICAVGSQTDPASCTLTVVDYDQGTVVSTQSISLTGSSGTYEGVIGNGSYDVDSQYIFEVTLNDALNSATKNAILSSAYFTFDVLAGGHGVAFGKPALTAELMDVGYDIHSDGEVTATDSNSNAHNLTEKVDKAGDTMTGELTMDDACINVESSNIDRDGANPSSNVTGNSYMRFTDVDGDPIATIYPRRETDGTTELGVRTFTYDDGSDSIAAKNFYFRGSKTGTGTLLLDGPQFARKCLTLDITQTPSETVTENQMYIVDKNGNYIGQLRANFYTSKTLAFVMVARQTINGTIYQNSLGPHVKSDGSLGYTVSSPSAFCEALHVGDYVYKSQTENVSMANSSYTNVASVSLAAGTWIIYGQINWASNATGRRYAYISTSSATSNSVRAASCNAVNGGTTYQNLCGVMQVTATSTFYLVGFQNSGAALNATGHLRAVRIK